MLDLVLAGGLAVAIAGLFNFNRGSSTVYGLQLAGLANINQGSNDVYGLQIAAYNYAADERLAEAGRPALAIVAAGLIPVIVLITAIARARPGQLPDPVVHLPHLREPEQDPAGDAG